MPVSAAEFNMKLGWAETADPMGHPCSAAMAVFKDYVENLTKGACRWSSIRPDSWAMPNPCWAR